MKRILIFITILLAWSGCKEHESQLNEDVESNAIRLLKADFEKQTGYDYSKEYLLTPAFRTKVNWEKAVQKDKDTILVAVTVLDTVFYPINGSKVNLKNNVILKAVRNKNLEWRYATVTFIRTNVSNGYSGLIISRSILDNNTIIRYFDKGYIIKNPALIQKKFANTAIRNQANANSKNRAECTYGYVNGYINVLTCDNGGGGEAGGGNNSWEGNPNDSEEMMMVPEDGGGVPNTYIETNHDIIDSLQGYPCAQAVLAKIPNLENKISEWLNMTFANNVNYNITFKSDINMPNQTDGTHIGYETNTIGRHTITLNGNMLQTASQEYIAVTMFHEALHGFLASEFYRLNKEGKSNQFGILYPGWSSTNIGGQDRFVNNHSSFASVLQTLVDAVKSLNPSMNSYDALALAKGGVVSNMNQIELSINQNHKNGNAGTKCN